MANDLIVEIQPESLTMLKATLEMYAELNGLSRLQMLSAITILLLHQMPGKTKTPPEELAALATEIWDALVQMDERKKAGLS